MSASSEQRIQLALALQKARRVERWFTVEEAIAGLAECMGVTVEAIIGVLWSGKAPDDELGPLTTVPSRALSLVDEGEPGAAIDALAQGLDALNAAMQRRGVTRSRSKDAGTVVHRVRTDPASIAAVGRGLREALLAAIRHRAQGRTLVHNKAVAITRLRSRFPPVLKHGPLRVDLKNNRVTWQGVELEVRILCFIVLAVLASQPGRTFTYAELYEAVWGDANRPKARYRLGKIVADLREELPEGVIGTVRAVGHVLRIPKGPTAASDCGR